MEKNQNKVIGMAFLVAAATFALVVDILMKVLSNVWGAFARATSSVMVQNSVPLTAGLICFLFLIFNKRIRGWAGEVVTEISKIIWPSMKETRALTLVVTIIIILSAFVLAAFDLVSSHLIQFILDL